MQEFARSGEHSCTRIDLLRGRGSSFNDEIRSWHRKEEPSRFDLRVRRMIDGKDTELDNPTIRDFAHEIVAICEGEVHGTSGKHRFTVRSTLEYGTRQLCSFVLAIQADLNDGEADSDMEPSNGGQTSLIMGGFRDLLRVNKEMHSSTLGMVGSLAREQQAELRELRVENADLYRKLRELENDKTQQEWEIYQAQLKDNRDKQSLDRVFQLGSVAIAAFAKGALPPAAMGGDGAGNPIVMVLREFFASLRPDQGPRLMQVLDMSQIMMLQQINTLVTPPPEPTPPGPNPSPNGSTNGVS